MSEREPSADPAELALGAAQLLHTARAGVLATFSAQYAGWPHGSLAPYAVGRDGALILVLSALAEHTRNALAEPRASVFVQDPGPHANVQSTPRLCAMGRVGKLAGDAERDAKARYLARFPEGGFYLGKLDFAVYALAVERVHLIGGFGKIAWLEGADYAAHFARDGRATVDDG